jgi:hypothetical protein
MAVGPTGNNSMNFSALGKPVHRASYSSEDTAHPHARPWLGAWFTGIVAALALFAGADFLIRGLANSTHLASQAVDIQAPDTYLAKLALVHQFPGRAIAVIGDSQIVGHAMAEHGDPYWRQHTLDRALIAKLAANPLTSEYFAVNFGANGLLPADIEVMAGDVSNAGAAAIVFNISLRSFSAAFNKPDTEFARPWLKTLCRDTHLSLPRACDGAGISGRIQEFLTQHWRLYQLLGMLEDRFIGGRLRDALVNLTNQALSGARSSEDVDDMLLLMLRARARFASVSFNEAHLEARALARTLLALRQSSIPTVIYYSPENPAQFSEIMDPERAARNRSALLSAVNSYASPQLIVAPPIDVPAENFLDYMHVNADGYRIVAARLFADLTELLRSPNAALDVR